MTSSISERLRGAKSDECCNHIMCDEAADCIDAQAATIKALVEALKVAKNDISEIADVCWDKRDTKAARIACAEASDLLCEAEEKIDAALAAAKETL